MNTTFTKKAILLNDNEPPPFIKDWDSLYGWVYLGIFFEQPKRFILNQKITFERSILEQNTIGEKPSFTKRFPKRTEVIERVRQHLRRMERSQRTRWL